MAALRFLSHQAVTQLELRRNVAELDETRKELAGEKRQADQLLRGILPRDIADELTARGRVRPRFHESVTILFTDFKDFTQLAGRMEPRDLIDQLNEHFSAFDDIVSSHGAE